jgi:hypothetical protein
MKAGSDIGNPDASPSTASIPQFGQTAHVPSAIQPVISLGENVAKQWKHAQTVLFKTSEAWLEECLWAASSETSFMTSPASGFRNP